MDTYPHSTHACKTSDTPLKSTGILQIGQAYFFELVLADEDHLEFKATNRSTNIQFSKKYTFYQLKSMSPLLFFCKNIEEAYEKLYKKISEKKYKITDSEAEKHIHLHLTFILDGEEKSSAFKLLKLKDKPFEVNDIEGLTITPIREDQVGILLSLIKELAEYEKSLDLVVIDEETLKNDIFNEKSHIRVVLLNMYDRPIGYAIYLFNYFSWTGTGVYLDDLYVKQEFRNKGIGKNLFAYLAKVAVEMKCDRVEWIVLDWNEPSIEFYNNIGANPFEGWIIYRLLGDNTKKLAAQCKN
jgi:GNAT superfamily N-acetyltransferase